MSLPLSSLATLARRLATAGALSAGLVGAAQAVTFVEFGDAGAMQGTAQVTTGLSGPLTDIVGTLSSSFDADLYLINITNPSAFSASTVNVGTTLFDTQIFLLTRTGAPVLFNDDDSASNSSLSTLPVGSFTLASGQYIVGVAESGYNPMNVNSQLLFGDTVFGAVQGPTSGLSPALLAGYSNQTYLMETGAYDLKLTGATVAAVPEASTYALMLLGVGVLGIATRRRGGSTT